MSLRPTMRRANRHMATIRLTTHIDSALAATILAASDEASPDDDTGGQAARDITARAAGSIIRTNLYRLGRDHFHFWTDDLCDIPTRVQWAARQVRRHWPAFDDEALAAFERSWTTP